MATGDWPSGATITLLSGYLPQIAAGQANVAAVDYEVVLPSGATVFNGGRASQAPFQFTGDPTATVSVGAMALVAALAAYEGLNVVMAIGTMSPAGVFTPATAP